MRLRLISEIQLKTSDTNMDRSNVAGVFGTTSINDLYRKDGQKIRKPKRKHKSIK